MRVAILLFQGVEELDFVGVYEVLAKARLYGCNIEVRTIARENPIKCANGLIVVLHESLEGIYTYDVLVIPGGRGINSLMENEELLEHIKTFSKEKMVCSVCTGAFLLAKAGILEGKKATTHHAYLDILAKLCQVENKRVVEDGKIMTSGGVSASIDLGIKILERFCGSEVARKVAERIEWPSASND